jgi:outer membrane protein assembly factor BamB/tetratricopeptide (TPR) repeat protein
MTLKGDLKEINLADIFQTLSMNRQVGTLAVIGVGKKASIYFAQEGIQLLTTEDSRYPKLGQILVARKMITDDQLTKALAEQKKTSTRLGEMLVSLGVVTSETIESCVRAQTEEIIYDVFSWEDAKFEFDAGPPKGKFFDPENLNRKLTFNVNGIIMEAARRIDDWERIHKAIPNIGAVPISTKLDLVFQDAKKLEFKLEDILRIFQIVNGKRPVSAICAESPFSDFDTNKILMLLLARGFVRLLEPPEIIVLAEEHIAKGRHREAVELFESALQRSGGNLVLHSKLAGALEKIGRIEDAAHKYISIGIQHLQQGNAANAVVHLERAVALSPRNFAAHQSLYEAFVASKEYEKAAAEAVLLAKGYERLGKMQESCEILEKTLPLVPTNHEVKTQLANTLIELGQKDRALTLMEELVAVYKSSNQQQAAAAVMKKMLAVDGSRLDVRTQLAKFEAPKAEKRGQGWKIALIAIALLIAALAAGAFLYETQSVRPEFEKLQAADAKLETKTRELIARTQNLISEASRVDPMTDLFDNLISGIDRNLSLLAVGDEYIGCIGKLNKFKDRYAISFIVLASSDVSEETSMMQLSLQNLDSTRKKIEELKESIVWRIFNKAEDFYIDGRFGEALECYRRLANKPLEHDKKTQVENAIEKIDFYRIEASKLAADAARLEQEGKLDEAREAVFKLIRSHRYSDEAKSALVPFGITSTPSGASIELNGKPLEEAATPYVYHYRHDDPEAAPKTITLKLRSYRTETLDVGSSGRMSVKLTKIPAHAVTFDWRFRSRPAIAGNRMYVCTAGSTAGIIALQFTAEETKVLWTCRDEAFAECTSRPTPVGEMIIVAGKSQTIHALEAETGKPLWNVQLPAFAAGAPSKPDASGTVYVLTLTGQLCAVSTADGGKLLWCLPVSADESNPFKPATDPHLDGTHLFFGAEDGRIVSFDVKEKRLKWALNIGSREFTDLYSTGESIIFGLGNGSVISLNPQTGEVIWNSRASYAITAPPIAGDGTVFTASLDGTIHALDAGTGRKLAEFTTGGTMMGAPALENSMLYAAGASKVAYALKFSRTPDPKFAVVWEHQMSAPSQNEATIVDMLVVFTATLEQDGKVKTVFVTFER